jgi:iron complex transport system substrate-binding protein
LCLALALLLSPAPGAAEPRLTDDFGRETVLAGPARRIVSLYAGFDETLAAMGLGDLVVGRTKDGDDAPALQNAVSVGTHLRPNAELIAGLDPDLVLQMGGREDAAQGVETLARLGLPVVVLTIGNVEDLLAATAKLGLLTGRPEAASALIRDMRAKLEAASPKPGGGKRPRVYFEVREQSPIGAGRGSFASDVIRLAGGENALASKDKFVRLGEEAILAADPDVVLIQRGPMNQNPTHPKDRPRLARLRAVAEGRVYFVDEKTYSRPSPRCADAVAELAGLLGQTK